MANYIRRFLPMCFTRKIYSSTSGSVHKMDELRAESFLNSLFSDYLDNSKMREIAKLYNHDLTRCLAGDLDGTTLKVYNTFIQDFSNGKEFGTFLTVYISSEQIKFMEVCIDKGWIKKRKREVAIEDFQRNEYSADMIIALVADYLLHFIKEDSIPLSPMAITHDLPYWIDQTSLNRGNMQYWNMEYALLKSFQSEINALLTSFMGTYGMNIKIKAILDSGNACFMDSQWKNPSCIGGVNMGVETTVCHLEKTDQVSLKGIDEKKSHVLVSTELSNFGSKGELDSVKNSFDLLNDIKSSNPGKKIFEKMTSDKYLGELFRLIAVNMIEDNILLDGIKSPQIMKEYSINTKDMLILEQWERNEAACRALLSKRLGYKRYHIGDLATMRRLSQYLCDRALRLAAVPLAVMADRSTLKEVSFAANGRLFRQYTPFDVDFSTYVVSALIDGKDVDVLKASKNAPLRGAALLLSRLE